MIRTTYYGHSCFAFEVADIKVLIDPFISGNPLAGKIDPSSIKPEYIFLTHGHGDHVSDVELIASKEMPVIANFEVAEWFSKKGLNAKGMNPGGVYKAPFGKVRFVSAVHSSSMPDGAYGGVACGFVFMTEESTFYVSGDTGLTLDMKLIPEICGTIDFCILPIGGHFTMDVEDAIRAAKMINCRKMIGCHYDTFLPIKIDHQEAMKKCSNAGIDLKLPEIGEVFEF
ncbi:UNVERIFIED_CONTAM: hypothetical protein GTU68_028322 [Idotea baltica]|nr:hypothetical protein [Idotea baltica]